MKRYINTNTIVHLRDVVDTIDYFVLVDDVSTCNFGEITASDDVYAEDEEFYATIPDDVFKKMLDNKSAKTENITNIHILDRIAKLNKKRLTPNQLLILKTEYEKHIELDDTDKNLLLGMFKRCNKIFIEDRNKNVRFKFRYNLTDDDILNILHNLTISDFRYKTRSTNFNHLGNVLILLKPKILIPDENIFVGVNLYVKLDIDYKDKSCAAFVSFHPEDPKPTNYRHHSSHRRRRDK